MFCTKCGNELQNQDVYCTKCGENVSINQENSIDRRVNNNQTIIDRISIDFKKEKFKYYFFFSVLVIAFGLIIYAGYSSTKNNIVGRWTDSKDIIEFKSDGRFTAEYYWIGGSYEIKGNKLVISSFMEDKKEFDYEIKGDELTINKVGKFKRMK